MSEKKTQELENVLSSTHVKNFDSYCKENASFPECRTARTETGQ